MPDAQWAHRADTQPALVHGWGMHGGIWAPVVTALGQATAPVCLDLPGHGSRPAEPAELSRWAAALADALPGPRVWVGWSLGGLVCLQLALARPSQVRALVLVAATPRFTAAEDWPWAVAAPVLEQFGASLRRDREATLDRFLALQVRGSADARRTLRHLRRARAQAPTPTGLSEGLALLRQCDLRPALAGIHCPVWLVGGERDTLVPPQALAATAAALREAVVEIVPGAGHAPFLAAPRRFAAGLRRFLDAHGLRARRKETS